MDLNNSELTIPAVKLARIIQGYSQKTTNTGETKHVLNDLTGEIANYFTSNVLGFDKNTWFTACGVNPQKSVAA